MKFVYLLFLASLMLNSCKEEKKIKVSANENETQKEFELDLNNGQSSMKAEDDFSDLKKKDDENCEEEESIEKKLTQKKQEAFQLQGGDPGCSLDEAESSKK